ncbi:MAG TPA: dicarboxylate/amino acid:cation symporter, partial [Gemmatimonadales bacterium]|nr:dicarboxylate/amino acid:cation symporter [Gemmatimonadales bacterium]
PPVTPPGRFSVKLHNKIILALFLGAAAGITANQFAAGAGWLNWFNNNVANPVGQVFLRMLLMTVIPLVFASLTLGVAGLGDIRRIGRVGTKTVAYFLGSTAIAATLGLILVNIIQPGVGIDPAVRQELLETYRSQAEGLGANLEGRFGINTFVNIVPRNPVQAAANLDMLAIIFFALMFGTALTLIPAERAKPMIGVLEALGDVVIKIIDIAMKLAPYGVFGLIFFTTSRFGWDLLQSLGLYVAAVLGGLLLHSVVVVSALVRVFGGLNPWLYWKRIRASVATAFSTSSSSATLPTNLAVAEQELGIPPRIAGFVLPLGSTMCMNGTALYEGMTVLFLAQVFGVSLSLGSQVIVVVLAVLTAVGAAGVPGGSLPLIMVVLATVGVPPEGLAIILGVDRILDMARTTVNVASDMSATVYVARAEGGWKPEMAAERGEMRPAA